LNKVEAETNVYVSQEKVTLIKNVSENKYATYIRIYS